MLQLMIDSWKPIYNLSMNGEGQQTWEAFYEAYKDDIFHGPEVVLEPATGRDLFLLCEKRKTCKAGGLDGFKTRELKLLSAEWWQLAADVLNGVVEGQPWPEAMLHVPLPSLKKEEGAQANHPEKQRNLTLNSVIYSLGVQFWYNQDQTKTLRDSWMHESMRGARQEATTQDVTYSFLLLLNLQPARTKALEGFAWTVSSVLTDSYDV